MLTEACVLLWVVEVPKPELMPKETATVSYAMVTNC
jgi:hypothetical protein